MAGVLVATAELMALYRIAWLTHRSLVASETTPSYEDAFPLADAWLALCLVAAAFCLLTARRAALFWLLAGGGAGRGSTSSGSTTSNTASGARAATAWWTW